MTNVDMLWHRFKEKNDSQAREQLILEYAHLARYAVDRLNLRATAAVSIDDLIGYAVIGLIEAVERFEPSRDVKFETFASIRIRGAVLDALKALDWLPRSTRDAANELRRTMARLEYEYGHPPSDEQVADAMGITTDELGEVLLSTSHSAILSLDELMLAGEDESIHSGIGVSSCEGEDPFRAAELEERKRHLACAIGELPEREKLVISLYYKEGLTLKEIAQVLEVTESRACQLHSKAVTRLNGKLVRHADLMLAAA